MTIHEGPLWLVGAGNMGGAMLRGWIDAGVDPAQITVIDPHAKDLPTGVLTLAAPRPDGAFPATLILAVKPQMIDDVAPLLAPLTGPGTLLVSILAGVEIASLQARFPAVEAIARVMPNMPVAIGAGVMAVHAQGPVDRHAVAALLDVLGVAEWIDREELFDAVTAVSGCGPAFLFRFIDAMATAGRSLGLPADVAARLALYTVEGSARIAAQADASPSALADRVASPGGSTREGMNVLDADEALARLMRDTLAAAARRNAELAVAARA